MTPKWSGASAQDPVQLTIEAQLQDRAFQLTADASRMHNAPPAGVLQLFESVQIFQLQPSKLKDPSPAAVDATVPQLRSDGFNLPTVLSVIAGSGGESLGAIREELRRAIPTLSGFSVLPGPVRRGNQSIAGHRLVFKTCHGATTLEASEVSDGIVLFLGYLTLLYHPNPPPLLLIEEPETGVHPSRLKGILRLLRRLTQPTEDRPGVQIVLTTHSPYLLDDVDPEEAWFCHRLEDGRGTATRFDRIPDIQERLKQYMLGELWTAYGEERLYQLSQRRSG